MIMLNIQTNKIDPYSLRKIITNPILEYSTLYPEINSDSPSTKSKGGRSVSHKLTTNQILHKSMLDIKLIYHDSLSEYVDIKIEKTYIKLFQTSSYLTLPSIDRMDPNDLSLDDEYPIISLENTFKDTTLIKNRTPTYVDSSQFNESIDHIRSIRMNPRTGPLVSIDRFVWSLEDVSFHNNLSPSTLDWSDPDNHDLFGDLRFWEYPNIFRSTKVINPIPTNINLILTNNSTKWNIFFFFF